MDWPGGQLRAAANGSMRELVQKCSGGQLSQDPLVVLPNVPASHETEQFTEFGWLKLLHAHRLHGPVPNPSLYLPPGQALHAPPVSKRPASQPSHELAPASARRPTEQGVHSRAAAPALAV
jgi:hypothetical protein